MLDSLKLDHRYKGGEKKKGITGNSEINSLMVVCLCVMFQTAIMGQGKDGRYVNKELRAVLCWTAHGRANNRVCREEPRLSLWMWLYSLLQWMKWSAALSFHSFLAWQKEGILLWIQGSFLRLLALPLIYRVLGHSTAPPFLHAKCRRLHLCHLWSQCKTTVKGLSCEDSSDVLIPSRPWKCWDWMAVTALIFLS